MKTYIATLGRESMSLDVGFKIVVVKNGTEYLESELTSKFPKLFVEKKGDKEVEAPKAPVVEAPKEKVLLTDDTSAVEVKVVEEVKAETTAKKSK